MPNSQFWIPEVQKIMKKGGGPFTRKMIAVQLEEKHKLYHQEAMLGVSIAIQEDKGKLFKRVRPGWWDLA
jgi:flagellar basal body rod protein FlgC